MPVRFLDEETPRKGKVRFLDEIPSEPIAKITPEKIRGQKLLEISGRIAPYAMKTILPTTPLPPAPISPLIGRMGVKGASALGGGLPELALSKLGIEIPSPASTVESFAGGLGALAGTVAGPGALGAQVAKRIAPKALGVIPAITRGAVGGAVTGAAMEPVFKEKPELGIPSRMGQTIAGSALGMAAPFVGMGVKNLRKATTQAKSFAEKTRQAFFNQKLEAGRKFEQSLNALEKANPAKVVDIRPAIEALNQEILLSPKIRGDVVAGIRRSGDNTLRFLLDNPEGAKELTLAQVQQIKQTIKKIPSIATKLKQGKFAQWSDTDISLLDFLDDVKSNQLDVFPEMSEVNAAYRNTLEKYNVVKSKFKVGKLLSNIEKKFGDKEIQAIVNELLPKDVIKEMGGYRQATKFLKTAGWLGGITAGSAVASAIGASFLSRRLSNR